MRPLVDPDPSPEERTIEPGTTIIATKEGSDETHPLTCATLTPPVKRTKTYLIKRASGTSSSASVTTTTGATDAAIEIHRVRVGRSSSATERGMECTRGAAHSDSRVGGGGLVGGHVIEVECGKR